MFISSIRLYLSFQLICLQTITIITLSSENYKQFVFENYGYFDEFARMHTMVCFMFMFIHRQTSIYHLATVVLPHTTCPRTEYVLHFSEFYSHVLILFDCLI